MTPNEMAAQFADDARALRERADALAAKAGKVVGPGVAASRAMAEACERVAALCAVAGSDPAGLHELRRSLERHLAGERDVQARHVYAGALERLRPPDPDAGDWADEDAEDELDDDFDDDELDDDDLDDEETRDRDGAR